MTIEPLVEFRVLGRARTAGSKVSGVAYRKDETGRRVPVTTPDGRIRTFTKDSSGKHGENWRTDVRAAASEAMAGRPPIAVPVRLDICVYVERPKGHWRTGRNSGQLRDAAPALPTSRQVGDCSKLARALEDAIIGLVFADDSLVTDLRVRKRYADGRVPGVDVRVERDGSDSRFAAVAEGANTVGFSGSGQESLRIDFDPVY